VSSAEASAGELRRAVVIANPISGRGRGARAAEELAAGLRRRGIAAEVHSTAARGDALAYLRAQGDRLALVCSVGGDGTLRECFEGLVDPRVPVLVLPFGTANVLAHELRLPRDVHHAVELAIAGRTQPIDVARVDGRMSFLVTGVGIDGIAVAEVERRRRGPITRWSYVGAVLESLRRYAPPRLTVTVDGRRIDGEVGLVLIANTGGYGGLMRLAPDARIDDGRYEVYLFPTGRLSELVRAFVRGVVRRLPGGPVRMVRGSRVRVESPEPVPYQVDGDTGGVTPVELVVSPTRYHLIVP
jgi:YegS/Rv2252/BmrU family lipid kinase